MNQFVIFAKKSGRTAIFQSKSQFRRGQLYKKLAVIVIGGFVAAKLSAFFAPVYDYKAFFGVCQDLDGFKLALAFACPVARIDVHVQRPEAVRAVVPRRVSERRYLPSAMSAYKSVVVFCESFGFHNFSFNFLRAKPFESS